VILVEALSPRHQTVIVRANFVWLGHGPLHPRVRLYLRQGEAFFRVMLGEAHDEVEEVIRGFNVPILHSLLGVAMQTAIVRIVRGCKRELGVSQDE